MLQTKQNQSVSQHFSKEGRSKSAGNHFIDSARKTIKATFISFLISIFACLILELIFAAANVGEDTVVKPDPLLGYAHLENKELTYKQEGYSKSRTNSLGFRDQNYPLVKSPGTTRIAVLGDSMTVGMEVPIEKTFCKLLEKRLNESKPQQFEVMNCAMSGFGTGQEYLLYRQKVEQFKPDILLVTYNYGDSDDNVFQRAGMNPPRPVFQDEHGRLKVDWHEIDNWYASNDARFYSSFEWLRRNSRLLAVLNKLNLDLSSSDPIYQMILGSVAKPVTYLWSNFLSTLAPVQMNVQAERACALPSVQFPPRAIPPAEAKHAVPNDYTTANEFQRIFLSNTAKAEVARAIFRAMNNECKSNNCKLVIAFGPALTNSSFYYRELDDLSRQAKQEDFSVIRANQAFPPRAPMEISPYFFGLHFTRAGHQIMSDAIYNQLFAPEKTIQRGD